MVLRAAIATTLCAAVGLAVADLGQAAPRAAAPRATQAPSCAPTVAVRGPRSVEPGRPIGLTVVVRNRGRSPAATRARIAVGAGVKITRAPRGVRVAARGRDARASLALGGRAARTLRLTVVARDGAAPATRVSIRFRCGARAGVVRARHFMSVGTADGAAGAPLPELADEHVIASGARFVAPGGDDAAAGTVDAPFRTIQRAVDLVRPGETIYVRAGDYHEFLRPAAGVWVDKAGRPDAWITIRNYPGERPRVRTEGTGTFTIGRNAAYVEVRGFELVGMAAPESQFSGAGLAIAGHHIRVINNQIHDFPASGIGTARADYLHVEGNRIWGNGRRSPQQGSGVSLYQNVNADGTGGVHNVIRGNVIHDNENLEPPAGGGPITDGNCVIVDDGRNTQNGSPHPAYGAATLIENNVCFDNGGRGIHVHLSDNVLARNNTLLHNARSAAIPQGELSVSHSGNVTFRNNLVIARPGKPANWILEAPGTIFAGNLYASGSAPGRMGPGEAMVPDMRLRRASVDPARIDPRPRANSPAIGWGLAGDAPAADLLGRPRPVRSTVGAYEG